MQQVLINILISGSLYLLIGSSFSLIYYSTKFFHLAHAVIITLGAYLTFLFINQFSLPLGVSIALAILIATVVGSMCEILVYKKMRKNNSHPLSYLIASIGIYVVIQNLISIYFGDSTKILRIGEVKIGNEIFGGYITNTQIAIIFISLILFISLHFFVRLSSTGKSIRAVSSNPELSRIYGINSNNVILLTFFIASIMGAVAGILSAMDTNMTPVFGFNLLLYGVVAMIVGGVGNTGGIIAGAFLISTSQHFSSFYFDNKWMDTLLYIILILFLIWKPLGFSGKQLKKVEI